MDILYGMHLVYIYLNYSRHTIKYIDFLNQGSGGRYNAIMKRGEEEEVMMQS